MGDALLTKASLINFSVSQCAHLKNGMDTTPACGKYLHKIMLHKSSQESVPHNKHITFSPLLSLPPPFDEAVAAPKASVAVQRAWEGTACGSCINALHCQLGQLAHQLGGLSQWLRITPGQ